MIDIKKRIRRLTTPIFEKSLQEASSNSMTTVTTPFKVLWRPNNYRRCLTVKVKSNSAVLKISSTIPSANQNKHNKLVTVRNYKGITIQYGRSKLMAIYGQSKARHKKLTYLIERRTIPELNQAILEKALKIKSMIDDALISFAKQFNIYIRTEKPVWKRYEDWIRGDDFIDNIPKETIIHDWVFKKVYDTGIEFIDPNQKPTAALRNYIRNRAIEDVAPNIEKEFRYVRAKMYRDNITRKQFHSDLALYNKNIKLHLSILKDMKNTLKKMNKKL